MGLSTEDSDFIAGLMDQIPDAPEAQPQGMPDLTSLPPEIATVYSALKEAFPEAQLEIEQAAREALDITDHFHSIMDKCIAMYSEGRRSDSTPLAKLFNQQSMQAVLQGIMKSDEYSNKEKLVLIAAAVIVGLQEYNISLQ